MTAGSTAASTLSSLLRGLAEPSSRAGAGRSKQEVQRPVRSRLHPRPGSLRSHFAAATGDPPGDSRAFAGPTLARRQGLVPSVQLVEATADQGDGALLPTKEG